MTTEAPAALAMVTIDCADPAGEAAFWAAALGWEVTYADDNYGMASDGTQRLGFGRIEGWQPPAWPNPDGTKQFHLDLAVADQRPVLAAVVNGFAARCREQFGEALAGFEAGFRSTEQIAQRMIAAAGDFVG